MYAKDAKPLQDALKQIKKLEANAKYILLSDDEKKLLNILKTRIQKHQRDLKLKIKIAVTELAPVEPPSDEVRDILLALKNLPITRVS